MTVGKDAVERSTKPPLRRRLPRKRSHVFLLGISTGVFGAAVVVALVRLWGASDLHRSPPPDELSVADTVEKLKEETSENTSDGGVLDQGLAKSEDTEFWPKTPEITVVEGEIQPNQFLATMLTTAGLGGGEADRTVKALSKHFDPTKSRPGDRYRVDVFADGELGRFEYQPAPDEVYLIARGLDGELVGRRLDIELKKDVVVVHGKIEHSLWEAFEASGESPALAADLTEAFQFDIDFFHDTRKGDQFRFLVEKYTNKNSGELVRYGQIYAAEYLGTKGSPVGTKRLFWYKNPKTRTKGFYDEKGRAAQRAFLRSPLKYTRISSGFGFRRHPILGKRHFHGGIDYAAPTGTPVRAVAAGTVTFAQRAGANGKIVKIKHSGGYESFYLHLSKILVRKRQRVSQSTVIGRVGSTGRSTGPHLDFRIKRHGKYLNPRKNVAPRTKKVPKSERKVFSAQIKPWVERLKEAPSASVDATTAEGASELATGF